MGRAFLTRGSIDPIQTTLARGYVPSGTIGNKLFPFVEVDKEGGQILEFGKELFLHHNTLRAMGANRNVIQGAKPTAKKWALEEHELSTAYDYREVKEAAYNAQTNARLQAQNGVMMDHEIMCATLASTTSNYSSGHYETLSGTDIFDNAASLPIDIIMDGKEVVRKSIGQKANVGWCGMSTYLALKTNPQILKMFPNTLDGRISHAQLLSALELDEIFVGEGVYLPDTAAENAANMTDIWGDDFGLIYMPVDYRTSEKQNYDELRPYFGYTRRLRGFPFVDEWGSDKKNLYMGYTDLFDVSIQGPDSAYLIKNCRS